MFEASAAVKGSGGAAVELYFADDAEKGEACVIVAVAPLSLVLVESDDLDVPRVLWYSSFLPALTKDYMQRMQ